MKIWLLGCEQETNRRLAKEGGATHLAMSFHSLLPRLPKKKPYDVATRFWGPLEVYLASGGHTLQKKSADELTTFEHRHWDFVEANTSALAMVTELDDARVDVRSRRRYEEALGSKFVPVWLAERGAGELEMLAERYAMVGIRSATFRSNPTAANRLRPLTARYGTQWHLLDGARPDELMTGRIHSAATTAWLSPMRNGETIVWDGVRMQRYPARMADQAKARHRSLFTRAGFDADAILEGDYQEITRYTVSAFIDLETYLTRRQPPGPPSDNPFRVVGEDERTDELPTIKEGNEPGTELELSPADVDSPLPAMRNAATAPTKRSEPLKVLPVFAVDTQTSTEIGPNGESITVERGLLRSSDQPLRQCDSCSVQATCPAFVAGAECGLGIPVDLRTKDQLFSAAVSMLEMQMARVAFMRYQEELNGGYSDPNTSSEIDRFYRMVEKLKELQENKESIRFQIEAKTGGGILSALFGEQAAAVRQLDSPVPSQQIIDAFVEE